MVATFVRRAQGAQASNNFDKYVLEGFLILTPIDICLLQDIPGNTNWMASFSKWCEMETTVRAPNINWLQPWVFCLTQMLAEGVIRESNSADLHSMFGIIENMRMYMHARVHPVEAEPPNYILPTFADWTAESQKNERSRLAQFCWFLASLGGNFNIATAGTWFPYCAYSRNVNHTFNSDFGMELGDQDFAELTFVYNKLGTAECQELQAAMHAHAGPLAEMTKTQVADTKDYVRDLTVVSASPSRKPVPKKRTPKPKKRTQKVRRPPKLGDGHRGKCWAPVADTIWNPEFPGGAPVSSIVPKPCRGRIR